MSYSWIYKILLKDLSWIIIADWFWISRHSSKSSLKLRRKVTGLKQGVNTLHQPSDVAIILRMRITISPGRVSSNHAQLFGLC